MKVKHLKNKSKANANIVVQDIELLCHTYDFLMETKSHTKVKVKWGLRIKWIKLRLLKPKSLRKLLSFFFNLILLGRSLVYEGYLREKSLQNGYGCTVEMTPKAESWYSKIKQVILCYTR